MMAPVIVLSTYGVLHRVTFSVVPFFSIWPGWDPSVLTLKADGPMFYSDDVCQKRKKVTNCFEQQSDGRCTQAQGHHSTNGNKSSYCNKRDPLLC